MEKYEIMSTISVYKANNDNRRQSPAVGLEKLLMGGLVKFGRIKSFLSKAY